MSRGVCVVTGGSRGIGAACSRLAATRGWDVLVNYRGNAEAAERSADAVRAAGTKAETVAADVSTPEGIAAVFEAADRMGTLTALVNNAGFSGPIGNITTFDFDRVDRVMRLNVTGAIMVAREAVMRMATRFGGTGGAIVNISSAAAKLGSGDLFVDYAATKGAIDTFTVGLAREWAADGIRVNAVRPGIIDTEFHAAVGEPDRVATTGPAQPMGRAGSADEVAEAVMWLLSDAASYTTGGFIDVSGGRSAVP